jgi:hypothetical protein
MPQFEAIAHVLWELPFPLRLPPHAFLTWEPDEEIALCDPRPSVGDLTWRRTSELLRPEQVFLDLGPPNNIFPQHDYVITARLASGDEIPTAKLTQGPTGGFIEPRPYTVANFFLCLRSKRDYAGPRLMERAGLALNNILDVYRFVTMDPLARSVRADLDSYYTIISVADLPQPTKERTSHEALSLLDTLSFGSTIGENRVHHIGLNSLDDLLSGRVLPLDTVRLFCSIVRTPHSLELFHQLLLEAVRRLKRGEHAFAILDAQSAFETFVAVLTAESLQNQGLTPAAIETQMALGGKLHLLQQRLRHLDSIATAPNPPFLGSVEETNWRRDLYDVRNRIVHGGFRSVSFADARAAVIAGLHAVAAVQSLSPSFQRKMTWSGSALDLPHIQQTAGRLSRLFEV